MSNKIPQFCDGDSKFTWRRTCFLSKAEKAGNKSISALVVLQNTIATRASQQSKSIQDPQLWPEQALGDTKHDTAIT